MLLSDTITPSAAVKVIPYKKDGFPAGVIESETVISLPSIKTTLESITRIASIVGESYWLSGYNEIPSLTTALISLSVKSTTLDSPILIAWTLSIPIVP